MEGATLAPTGAQDAQEGPCFQDLLKSLSAVHEQQQHAIRRLNEENAHLRQCLDLMQEPDDRGKKTSHIGETLNVQPPLPSGDDISQSQVQTEESEREDVGVPVREDVSLPSLRSQWPVPELWPTWGGGRGDSLQRVVTRSHMSKLCLVEDTTGQAMTMVNRCYQMLIIRPISVARLSWDFLSSVMVCYDVLTIPLLVISLDKHELVGGGTSQFTDVMDMVTTCFWTLDIPWSFMTGFHSDGVVEMRAQEIAKNYVKTWFVFDVLIILVDWVILYASKLDRGATVLGLFRIGKTVRMARILRAVRLLRFVKLQRVLAETLELINSESIRAVFNVSLAVAFIFMINHYLACGWYLAGHIGWMIDVPNWIVSNEVHLKGSSVYAYLTSLHWSLTQFTPASMEIRPYNIGERIYSISCLMFALITFSSFLGSITASITQLRKHNTDMGKQQFLLRSYFLRNKVSSDLSRRIWKFLRQHHFNHQTRSHKTQVAVLKLLPPHLQAALHHELYGPYITRAPFFYHYTAFCHEGVVEVCTRAVTEKTLIWDEVLFFEGKAAEKMFFTASGFMKYEHHHAQLSQTIGTGSWVAEPVLWVRWVHVAMLKAGTSAELIELDSQKFRETVVLYRRSLPYVKVYAQLFKEYLQQLGGDSLTDLMTDVVMLEALTRQAWCEVTTVSDRSLFEEMPQREFPRYSRQARVQELMLNRAKPRPTWRKVFDSWQRRSSLRRSILSSPMRR